MTSTNNQEPIIAYSPRFAETLAKREAEIEKGRVPIVTGAGMSDTARPVARMLHGVTGGVAEGKTIARTYQEMPQDSLPHIWSEGEPLIESGWDCAKWTNPTSV